MITHAQLNECKQLLIQRQNELIHRVQFKGMMTSEKESTGELSSYDNHPADMGTEQYERGKDLALQLHSEQELEKINEALHAIEEGTYGLCSTCGESISYERLRAVPTTDRCSLHAEEGTIQNNRPVEEGILSPNINPNTLEDREQVGYDAEDAWQEVSVVGTSETPSDFYGDRDNYNEMYPNSDEAIGEVESVEGFLTANLEGEYKGITPNYNKDQID